MCLTVFKNQILVLLGHNGAGKTTTLDMITSQVSATSGKVILEGEDLLKNYKDMVDTIGICPYKNVLLD